MFLIQPLIWVVLILFIGIIDRKKTRSKILKILSLILLVLFTNPYLINKAFFNWEPSAKKFEQLKHYDVAIVLGGFSNSTAQPRDRIHFVKGADRLIHAIELYKIGKVDKILLSGGTSRIIGEKQSEALTIVPFLVRMGIPKEDILIDSLSKNTHENAVESSKLIKSKFPYASCLLMTSAFHMKRSEACFLKEGLVLETFPTDYYGKTFFWSPGNTFMPRSEAFSLWNLLIKEWVGIAAYKVAGYI